VLLDANSNVDHIVSQGLVFLELTEEFATDGATVSGILGPEGYAATFYPAGYYDTVLANFGDTTQIRFQDSGNVKTPIILWEVSTAEDQSGVVAARTMIWLEETDEQVKVLEDFIGMKATPTNFDFVYKKVYDELHGIGGG
jgi:hypothetical protein